MGDGEFRFVVHYLNLLYIHVIEIQLAISFCLIFFCGLCMHLSDAVDLDNFIELL